MNINREKNLRIVTMVFFAYLISTMFGLSIGIIIPEVMKEYTLSEAKGGMLLTSILTARALAIILGGSISDKIGKIITLTIGFTIISTGILLGSFSTSYGMLLTFLFISGIGTGIFLVALYTFVGDFIPRSRGSLVGFTTSIAAFGGFLGPWIVAILTMNYGWRSPLLLLGYLGLTLSFFLWINHRHELFLPMIKKKSEGNYLIFLKDSKIITLCVAIGLGNFAFFAFAAWVPSYLVGSGSFNLQEAGFAFGFFSLIGALGASFYGILSDKKGRKISILASGFPAFVLSLLFFSIHMDLRILMVISGIFGFTAFAFWNLSISAVQDRVSNELLGSATGLILSIAMLSGAVAPTMAGLIINSYGFKFALISTVTLFHLMYTILAFIATR